MRQTAHKLLGTDDATTNKKDVNGDATGVNSDARTHTHAVADASAAGHMEGRRRDGHYLDGERRHGADRR